MYSSIKLTVTRIIHSLIPHSADIVPSGFNRGFLYSTMVHLQVRESKTERDWIIRVIRKVNLYDRIMGVYNMTRAVYLYVNICYKIQVENVV